MTSINSKLGLKPAGRRAMMRLPTDRALRHQVTAGVCPQCGRRCARLSQTMPGQLWCTVCFHHWPLPTATE